MNKNDLIMAKLNMLTVLEFKENYNKSEFERILFESEKIKEIKKEIEELLYSQYPKNEYDIMVSCSHIAINKIISKNKNSLSLQEYKKIWSDNFKKLPYRYVMGGKVGKRTYEEIIKDFI